MNHSSNSKDISFQLNLDFTLSATTQSNNLNRHDKNDSHLQSTAPAHPIDTGITYLPLPEPRLQLVKPRQSIDYKYQLEQDFRVRYQNINENELNQILYNIDANVAHRYKISYQHLCESLLSSILRIVDLDEEILQVKHSILYQNEILPTLLHNHKLAKREKKILYNLATKTWHKFDQCIQNEINVQYQLKQIQEEHENLLNIKIKQEQYQRFYFEIQEINNEIIYLQKEIQQLHDSKYQLKTDLHESQTRCSHYLIQLNFLQSNLIRSHTMELNHLQLERDSLITQTELIKYNLFEQIQQYDYVLKNYRVSLDSFRSTLHELEQQLKQQTDQELNYLQIVNAFQRQTITNDTQQLIFIFENKIDEKKFLNVQLEKTIEDFQEKIYKIKQKIIKKENNYQTMIYNEKQLNETIHIHREIYLQLKIERRLLERQLTIKSKQYSNDDRLNHTFSQQYDSLLARKKLEQIRMNTFNDQIHPLIDENIRLKTSFDQLYQQYTEINPNHLFKLRQDIVNLKKIQQTFIEQKIQDRQIKMNYKTQDEQLQIKNNRIANRINHILYLLKENNIKLKDNTEHIHTLENTLTEEQNFCLQSKYFLTRMKNRSESYRTKQNSIQMQIQIAFNNIKHSQYNLKIFTNQLSICHNDLIVQQTSLNKLRVHYSILQEQDEMHSKKLFTLHGHTKDLEKQYKISVHSRQKLQDDVLKYSNNRFIFGRMIVRRIDLCQLLYRKLARYDEHIHEQENYIQIITKRINSLKIQIHQIRCENKKSIEKQDRFQLEIVKVHMEKLLDQSFVKQRTLTKQIFQRRFYIKHSLDPLPHEDMTYLKTKFNILKTRLIKIICHGILCNFILMAIQREYSHHLEYYFSKTYRNNCSNLNSLRRNLSELMQQLKAKTAENNMLINYRDCTQMIHMDVIQQILQLNNKL
ncbi:hypothetical protein I4U23_007046 [Adineta vaga]|nr:hypothetical protein I4U23_007046 [Adineta vaga]